MLPCSFVAGLPIYRSLYKSEDYVFEGRYKGEPNSGSNIRAIMNRAVEAAGLSKKATPHSLRHSFPTHLLDAGTDLRILQSLQGQSSIKTTTIYTNVSNKAISRIKAPFETL